MPRTPKPPKEQVNIGERLVVHIQNYLAPYLSPTDEPYVGIPVDIGDVPDADGIPPDPPRIHKPLGDIAVTEWLLNEYYERYGHVVLSEQQIKPAVGLAKAQARKYSKQHDIPVRFYYDKKKLTVYVDLGRKDMQMVKVTPGRWEVVVNRGEVRFRRPKGMKELPTPTPPGTGHICDLRQFVNCYGAEGDANFYRMTAWLFGCYMPDGARPILVVNGGKGSGKTTAARNLRNLADPCEADLLQPPKDEEAIALRAFNCWAVAYDNLSTLTPKMSDNFCRLSTGSVLTKRQLYTDDGEIIWKVQRPAIINGIDQLVVRDDLSSRALVVNLPELPETRDEGKLADSEMGDKFLAAWPSLFSAVLDVAAAGLARLKDTERDTNRRERLGDLHLWITACESALGWQPGTMGAVTDSMKEYARAQVLDNVAELGELYRFMQKRPHQPDDGTRVWKGMPRDLNRLLRDQAIEAGINPDNPKLDWSEKTRVFTARLRRYQVELRDLGLTWRLSDTLKDGEYQYIFTLSKEVRKDAVIPKHECRHTASGNGSGNSNRYHLDTTPEATTANPEINRDEGPKVVTVASTSEPLPTKKVNSIRGYREYHTPEATGTTSDPLRPDGAWDGGSGIASGIEVVSR